MPVVLGLAVKKLQKLKIRFIWCQPGCSGAFSSKLLADQCSTERHEVIPMQGLHALRRRRHIVRYRRAQRHDADSTIFARRKDR